MVVVIQIGKFLVWNQLWKNNSSETYHIKTVLLFESYFFGIVIFEKYFF